MKLVWLPVRLLDANSPGENPTPRSAVAATTVDAAMELNAAAGNLACPALAEGDMADGLAGMGEPPRLRRRLLPWSRRLRRPLNCQPRLQPERFRIVSLRAILPLSGVSNPRQRMDLSDGPTANTTPTPNQLHPSSTTSTTRRTYAETLAGAAARTNNPKYRPVYARPTGEMLEKLIQLADGESIDDDTMLLAIEEACPFKVR
ncbi:hypothetical protein As57867_006200, partial [Aphanomyces stellatus]